MTFSTRTLARWFGVTAVLTGAATCGDGESLLEPQSLSGLTQPTIVSSIVEGDYVIRSVATNKCIDVSSSSTADGAKVQEWDCNGTNAQRFHIAPVGGGYFKILNVNSGKGLDIKDVSSAANTVVQQWSYGGGANQQFRFAARGGNLVSGGGPPPPPGTVPVVVRNSCRFDLNVVLTGVGAQYYNTGRPYNLYAKWIHDQCGTVYSFAYDGSPTAANQAGYYACSDARQLEVTFCPAG